jgi:CRP/FNR family transcriptional regulator, nitrogen oxide reductase regulator
MSMPASIWTTLWAQAEKRSLLRRKLHDRLLQAPFRNRKMKPVPSAPDASIIAGMEMFRGLDRDGLEDVVRRARSRFAAKGTVIFTQGEAAATCHALIDGRVKIVQSGPDGEALIIRYIGPGDMFGTLAVYSGGAYPASAEAVSDSVEIAWSADTMTELMLRHAVIAVNTLGIIGGRLHELQMRLGEVSNQRVERRIANALVRLVRQGGKRVEGGVEIGFPLSRQDIAEMTGTTLHTVSRTLSAWEAGGLVRLGRQRVVIAKPHAIVAIAEDLPETAARDADD